MSEIPGVDLRSLLTQRGLSGEVLEASLAELLSSELTPEEVQAYSGVWGNLSGFSASSLFRLHARGITPTSLTAALRHGCSSVNEVVQSFTAHMATVTKLGADTDTALALFQVGSIITETPTWSQGSSKEAIGNTLKDLTPLLTAFPFSDVNDLAPLLLKVSGDYGGRYIRSFERNASRVSELHDLYPDVAPSELFEIFVSYEMYPDILKALLDAARGSGFSASTLILLQRERIDLESLPARVQYLRSQVPLADEYQLAYLVTQKADLSPEALVRARELTETLSGYDFKDDQWAVRALIATFVEGKVSLEAIELAHGCSPEGSLDLWSLLAGSQLLQENMVTPKQLSSILSFAWTSPRDMYQAGTKLARLGSNMGDYIDFYIQEFNDEDLSRNLSYQLYYTNRNTEGFDGVAFNLANLEALKALYPDLPLSEFNKLAPLPANYVDKLASEFPGSYIAAFTSSWDILTHRSIRSNPEDITPEELGEKVGDFLSAFHKVNPEADLWESISAWSADVPTSKMSWLARRKIKETYSSFEHLVRPRFSSEGELKEWDNVKLFKGFAELPESMLLKQADKETSLKSSDSAVKKSLSTVSDLEATTLPKAPGMPSTLRAPDSSSLSDLSKATSLVDWVKDRYGEIATNFDTFFTMPALMDRSFEPLQDFITSLVDFQDAVSQGNVDGALALRKAEAARVLLEAAVSKATALGALALVNRSDGSAVLSKLATAAKTREMASSGTTPEERASFESKLEEQLASLADTLGGPRELSERLAIASAPHEPDATEEPEEAAEAPRRRFMRAPVRDSSSKVPGF